MSNAKVLTFSHDVSDEAQQPPRQPTLLELMWHKLDGSYFRYRRLKALAPAHPEKNFDLSAAKARCQGHVEMIAIMSHPLKEDDIKAECVRRYKKYRQDLTPPV